MAITNRIPISPWSSSLLALPNPAAALLELFEPAPATRSVVVNLHAGREQLVLTARMPGIDPAQLEVSLEEGLLHIAAKAPEDAEPETGQFQFQRGFRVPFRLDPDSIEASLRDGLLIVRAQRSPADAPRTIKIQSPQD